MAIATRRPHLAVEYLEGRALPSVAGALPFPPPLRPISGTIEFSPVQSSVWNGLQIHGGHAVVKATILGRLKGTFTEEFYPHHTGFTVLTVSGGGTTLTIQMTEYFHGKGITHANSALYASGSAVGPDGRATINGTTNLSSGAAALSFSGLIDKY
jgi:hypothetical protein